MVIWQADFYKFPSSNPKENVYWELLICDNYGRIVEEANCLQSQVNSAWLIEKLQPLLETEKPEKIQVFRPQSLNLLTLAGKELDIPIEANRHTTALKQLLTQRHPDWQSAFKLDQPPPQPVPDNLWGEQWRFAAFPAGELVDFFRDRPMPYLHLPEAFFPLTLGIPSTVNIPGVVIYGGRQSRYLAQWLDSISPVSLNFIPTEVGQSGGMILEAGLSDRWVLLTFEDAEIAQSGSTFETRKQDTLGLHFLLVQPDDSGMTYTGFWLLRNS
ncbi:MAG: Tab2/Atab2 family RNA-binding protein [Snowella sp.]|nr:Tab2/Atab2 family RNA-binding protein [Snowella sp.]